MEIRSFAFLVLLMWGLVQTNGQDRTLRGTLLDDQAKPLASGTVVLLNPVDSTMEFFGISDARGQFEIRNIKSHLFFFNHLNSIHFFLTPLP